MATQVRVLPARELVRDKEVCALLGVSRFTLREWRIKGILPPKVVLGQRVTGYWRPQLDEWMRQHGYPARTA